MENYRTYTDAAILDGIKNNDRQAYKAIYYDRVKSLRTYVLNNNGTTDDAYDIEQKSIIVLYEKVIAGHFVLTSKLSTYLQAVGRNLWLKELKIKGKYINESSYGDIDIGQSEEIELQLEPKNDDEAKLLKALNKLGEICQKLLKGKFYDNQSDKELSELMVDMTTENVRKRRYKCLQKMKKLFKQEN